MQSSNTHSDNKEIDSYPDYTAQGWVEKNTKNSPDISFDFEVDTLDPYRYLAQGIMKINEVEYSALFWFKIMCAEHVTISDVSSLTQSEIVNTGSLLGASVENIKANIYQNGEFLYKFSTDMVIQDKEYDEIFVYNLKNTVIESVTDEELVYTTVDMKDHHNIFAIRKLPEEIRNGMRAQEESKNKDDGDLEYTAATPTVDEATVI